MMISLLSAEGDKMERKIIGVISFFNLKQIIYVYENENQIEEK